MCSRVAEWFRDFRCPCVCTVIPKSVAAMKAPRFWQAIAAELVGTFMYVVIGAGAWIETNRGTPTPSDNGIRHDSAIRIAGTFAGVYASLYYVLFPISGAHFNPAVTVAMLALRRICIARALCYIAAQVFGAILAAGLLMGVTAPGYRNHLGATRLAPDVNSEQGFATEFFATILFVFVFAATSDTAREHVTAGLPRKPPRKSMTPFLLALALGSAHLFAVPLSGGSMNPARSFGPAVVSGFWNDHWVYWFGPLFGALLGALLYDTVFAPVASLSRVRICLLANEDRRSKTPRRPSSSPTPRDEEEAAERVSLKHPSIAAFEEDEPVKLSSQTSHGRLSSPESL